ncbi:TolC family protein [Marinobacter sp. Arc7-DN-1]|uniref:TolC family protein n=1 Tax=Marinobacter sp. Arc7-DN-1 TaxID=2304594 RepID=UPI0013C3179F|nr:TolC family protein [Marinobacter sp. Arc7-DN-1]
MFNVLFLARRKNRRAVVLWFLLSCTVPVSAMGQSQGIWTLEDSIRRVVEIAPEIRGAQAAVGARQGALQQAGVWPNPQIELRADDSIGKDAGTGGTDFTQFAISQPLPLSGRLGHQQAVAGAALDAARAEQSYQQIRLETQVAQRYHSLQLALGRLRLAQQRLQLADDLQNTGRRRAQAGELSELERLRMDLIREAAQQALNSAEGAYNEALSRFRVYLGLSGETTPQLTSLKPFGLVPALEQLQAGLANHPALLAAKHRVEAARSGVDLARAERLPDLSLSVFREQDLLNGRRQDVTGIGLGITIPLWDRNSGRIGEARAQVIEGQSELQVLERDLDSRLRQSYLNLNQLVKQGEHYRTRVFQPAQKVFELTRKAYASGEVEILSVIDANNTYFDAHERYLELLQEAWLEAADLRLAAGRALVATEQDTDNE